jgi:hypothetical protein
MTTELGTYEISIPPDELLPACSRRSGLSWVGRSGGSAPEALTGAGRGLGGRLRVAGVRL